MRVLILADELFAAREQAMIARLEVGLVDEGVRVIHAIPERAAGRLEPSGVGIFSKAITYSDVAMPFGDRFRATAISTALERLAETEEADRAIDAVHVFGGGVWKLGSHLARMHDAGLVLEVWRAGLVGRADAFIDRDGPPVVLLAPDHLMERALLSHSQGATVRTAPWGVHTPAAPRRVLADGRAPSFMVIGTGRDAEAYGAVLRGLAGALAGSAEGLIFMDARAAHEARVWPLAGSLGLLPRLSLIEELEGRRDLVLLGDVMIQPEASGEHRSVVLDAMATGMVVISADDPTVGALIDGQTCLTVPTKDGSAWAAGVRRILGDGALVERLAGSARAWVKEHHPASAQVRAVLDAYAWIASHDALPFPTPDG